MIPHPDQLAALVAIIDRGTFDAAARHLHVTTSAVSQRIRALETVAGQVLVRRTTPCTATEAGASFVRLARQTALLHDDLRLGGRSSSDLRVAVNADSLATWFRPVLDDVAAWDGATLRLQVEDQAYSADLLRRGDVLAAVTSEPTVVQGCAAEPLGVLRYRAAASPTYAERWRARAADGSRGEDHDWARMPTVVFDEKDKLQHDLLASRGLGPPLVEHRVPTSADFHEAVRRGLGWGLIPLPQLEPDLADGRLVTLGALPDVGITLYWQRWRLESPALSRLSEVVRAAARVLDHQPVRRPSSPS